MEDSGNGLWPSLRTRVTAALFVLVLIGSLALICVGAVSVLGPAMAHGTNVDHVAGKITQIGPGRNFILQTSSGQKLSFVCASQCRASPGHMQRHKAEHALTDVYYMIGPDKVLMAIDVD
ncbi:MAG TPA: hypothetical protein VFA41_17920 [Ktedonobacteraceae bacterium]|nr:hypothetical protein [Ktedonobacteraceae bacterium]